MERAQEYDYLVLNETGYPEEAAAQVEKNCPRRACEAPGASDLGVTGGVEPHALTSPTILRVAVDVPGAPGERLYDYLGLDDAHAAVGDGVIVPFGGRRAIGIVVALNPNDLPPAVYQTQVN